jgi:hypothetical protein
MKIGQGKLGGNKRNNNKKYFKLEKGMNVYRILPPLGEMADDGVWAKYYKVHYGYRGAPTEDGKPGRMYPFVSPEVYNRRNKMVEVEDEAKSRIDSLKEALVKAKDAGDDAKAKGIVNLLKTYNLDNKWYVNAMNLNGEIGLLKLPHKVYLAIEELIKLSREEGSDPIGVENGRFFSIRKSGEMLDTTYNVAIHKEKVNVEGIGTVEKEVSHTLSNEIINRLESEAFNLGKLFRTPSAEEVSQVVRGGPQVADELWGKANEAEEVVEEDEDGGIDALLASPKPQAAKAVGAQVASPVAETPSPTKVTPKKAAPAPAQETPVAAMKTTQTEEEFLASLGLK